MTLVLFFALATGFQAPECSSAAQCRQLAQDAIATGAFERAHDLAWLAYQRGSRQDPLTLVLLARAQSLSGRSDDAFVMLRRLAEARISVPELTTSEDFARVRNHSGWEQLRSVFEALNAGRPTTGAGESAPVTEASNAPSPASRTEAKTAKNAAPEAKGADDRPASGEAPPAFEASAATFTRVGEDLALRDLPMPTALAYDAVSARFILSVGASDALTVLSQTSTNAAAFTSRGWSGHETTTALAIDRGAGDLWVAVQGASGSAVHRLQLISGRRLDVINVAGDRTPDIIAMTLTTDALFALDRANNRVLRRARNATALTEFVTLPPAVVPTSLAHSPTGLYVAHADGILRIEFAGRKPRPLTSPKSSPLVGVHALAWHDRVLLGVRLENGAQTLVRILLNKAGTAATRVESLGPAAALAGTLSSGTFYYLAEDADGQRVLRAIAVR
jgi:hypothetical protein